MKTKKGFLIDKGPGADVKTLTARVREGAARRRAAPPAGGDAGRPPLERVLGAQADLNGAVAGSLRLVAQHLHYAREQFAALEESVRREEDERAQTDLRLGERLEQLSALMEGIGGRVEALAEGFAAFERRVNGEMAELRRGLRALSGAAAAPAAE